MTLRNKLKLNFCKFFIDFKLNFVYTLGYLFFYYKEVKSQCR